MSSSSSPPTQPNENKKRVSKEKLRTIMEAASALTALGDEESSESRSNSPAVGVVGAKKTTTTTATTKQTKKDDKRFLPDHKKPDAALTFPEKVSLQQVLQDARPMMGDLVGPNTGFPVQILRGCTGLDMSTGSRVDTFLRARNHLLDVDVDILMKMMRFAETQGEDFCIAWCDDGCSFVIRDCDEFTRTIVPKYFKPTKFSSFTRKLYRWGFRQINRGLGPEDPVIFGCAHFQRDAPQEMAHMRSTTAAGSRKETSTVMDPMIAMMMQQQQQQQQQQMPPMQQQMMSQPMHTQQYAGNKRTFDDSIYGQPEEDQTLQKRLLLSKLLQQQTMMQQQQHSMFGNINPNSALAMASMQHHQQNGNNQGYRQPALHHHSPNNYQQQFQQYQEAAALKPYPFMSQQQSPQSPYQMQGTATAGGGANTSDIVNAAIAALRNA
eukprot:scaffold8605_cov178-Amphora_coffeaeformis.AAC.11